MKKIYIILFSVLTLGLVSCNMDETPYNAIPDTEALQTANDFAQMRIGLYSPLRGMNSGIYAYLQDIEADNFNAVSGFSNTYGNFYTWQTTSETGEYGSVYSANQGLISRCNFIIDGVAKVDTTNADNFSAKDQAAIKLTVGEAYYLRAMCLFNLAQYFCADYDATTAGNANTGVSYMLTYAPSSLSSSYPARKTLKETYEQILSDLNEASSRITTKAAISSTYITVDCITALRARIALAMHDNGTAASQAVALINTGNYDLADGAKGLEELWVNDGGSETIWQLPCPTTNELASGNGTYFLPYTKDGNPDYLPSGDFINTFNSSKDYRFAIYFKKGSVTATNGTSGVVYEMNKYRDSSAVWKQFKTEGARFVSEPKVFRISEFYLIAAEAYAQQNDLVNAAKYLNALEKTRIAGYTDQSFLSKESAMAEIKKERRRELACEGTRLLDLKRWGDGISRTSAQILNLCLMPGSTTTTNLTKSASENRMVWPIPKHETDANPQVVQNTGW